MENPKVDYTARMAVRLHWPEPIFSEMQICGRRRWVKIAKERWMRFDLS